MVHNTTSDTSPSVPSPLMSPTDKTTWPKRPPVEGLGLERMMGVALRFPYVQEHGRMKSHMPRTHIWGGDGGAVPQRLKVTQKKKRYFEGGWATVITVWDWYFH